MRAVSLDAGNRGLYGRQRGAVLLLAVLLLLVATSYVLVSSLSAAATQPYRDEVTARALARAKEALIGAAASYPDQYPGEGPGQLPCPDTNYPPDGSPNPPCGPNAIGRLPWEFIGLDDTRDSSGETLWYALSNNFRNNPKIAVLNSDTIGQLSLDGTGDVVAVLFAPGASFSGQARPSNDVTHYLEGENSNGDTAFVSKAGGDFNDRVLTITRRELMATVEKRVLGEVDQSLARYRNQFGAFPWLAPFQDPTAPTSFFEGVVNTAKGHLPIYILDPPATPTRTLNADFTADWTITGGDASTFSGLLPPSEDCVRNNPCTELLYGAVDGPDALRTCIWSGDRNILDCTGDVELLDVSIPLLPITVTRTYHLQLTAGAVATITNPSPGVPRTRDFSIGGAIPPQAAMITVTDNETLTGTLRGQRILHTDVVAATGIFDVIGIPYNDLDPSRYAAAPTDPELPQWFIDNEWHHLTLVAYPDSTVEDPPGNAATPCSAGTNCIVIDGSGAPNDNKRAIAVSAGMHMPAVNAARPSGDLGAYFEGENALPAALPPDDTFERQQPVNAAFNDQVRVIATTP